MQPVNLLSQSILHKTCEESTKWDYMPDRATPQDGSRTSQGFAASDVMTEISPGTTTVLHDLGIEDADQFGGAVSLPELP